MLGIFALFWCSSMHASSAGPAAADDSPVAARLEEARPPRGLADSGPVGVKGARAVDIADAGVPDVRLHQDNAPPTLLGERERDIVWLKQPQL